VKFILWDLLLLYFAKIKLIIVYFCNFEPGSWVDCKTVNTDERSGASVETATEDWGETLVIVWGTRALLLVLLVCRLWKKKMTFLYFRVWETLYLIITIILDNLNKKSRPLSPYFVGGAVVKLVRCFRIERYGFEPRPGPGGGTPIYGLYRYVPRDRVWFLRFPILK